ncbi:FMRFamide-related peptide-like family-containing protein [Strongyloides ratti]|uniref:FMRFamide-related peptide-like family-containing protein n=1 Tax=Strongyloides ratti TaxID=34506 RepID=A0A090KQW2_STRRB|nr:FMRFamide-related peptide-like family-containing protein [Strongyloides ratti]CEF59749.1 FMRFamide-related peptide-like family-containing protein [Strongyloides ratti]
MASSHVGWFRYTFLIVYLITLLQVNFSKNTDDLRQIKYMTKNFPLDNEINSENLINLPDQNDIYKIFDIASLQKRKNEFIRFGKRKNEFIRFKKKNINNFNNELNNKMLPIYSIFDINDNDDIHTANKRKNEFIRFG